MCLLDSQHIPKSLLKTCANPIVVDKFIHNLRGNSLALGEKDDLRLHNEIFLARTGKNVAQDRSVLPVHEDLSNGFDEVDGEKNLIRQQSRFFHTSQQPKHRSRLHFRRFSGGGEKFA
ncbi:MAG: hypothetical protein LBT70_02240 [Holosporaceae bacterium]|nr:hypothetical protein [Holosporaceae bacterium]